MKRIVFTLALVMGFGIMTSVANNTISVDNKAVVAVESFTPIEVKSLPEELQEVLAMEYSDFSVASAEVEIRYSGEANYKVVLLNQENVEDVIVFSETGEVVE